MRYEIVAALLAGCGLILGGCQNAPALPSTPEKPSAPAPAMAPRPAGPEKPAAPSAPTAASAPSAPSTPAAPAAAKAVAPAESATLKADLSKIKFTADSAELFGWDEGESRAFFLTNGLGEVTVKVPADGDYAIVITASCQAAKGENANFKLKVDGVQVGAETTLKSEDAKDYTFAASLKAGERKIGAEFTNDIYKEGEYDRNFYLHGVKVVRK
jgi:hypothetical protein